MASRILYSSPAQILQRRQQLAAAFSGLKNIRPHIPFWLLAAHRIPVLWSLYRGLLKSASGENTRWRIRMFFEENRHLTSPRQTKDKLIEAQKLLLMLKMARYGDPRALRIAERYESMICAKRNSEHMKTLLRKAWAWQHRLDHRPILTGALFRPSVFNAPLPRMKPQPKHVSMMIKKRRRVAMDRFEKLEEASEDLDDLRAETAFEATLYSEERHLHRVPNVFRGSNFEINSQEHIKYLKRKYWEDIKRSKRRAPQIIVSQILAARREKISNKTRERKRILGGEIPPGTQLKRRTCVRGPPAHVLAQMSEDEIRFDRILREPSEGGYSGMVKKVFGVGLRSGDIFPEREEGLPENRPWLDVVQARIHDVNAQKRSVGQE